MSAAVRGFSASGGIGATASVSQASFSTAPQAGDLLIAYGTFSETNACFCAPNPSISGAGGGTSWTAITAANGAVGNNGGRLYYKPWNAADTSYTYNNGTGDANSATGFGVVAVSGANTSSPFDGTVPAAGSGSNTGSYVAPSVTPASGVGSLLLSFWAGFQTGGGTPPTITIASGMTAAGNSSSNGGGDGDLAYAMASLPLSSNAATGTKTATATPTSPTAYVAHSVVIAQATSLSVLPIPGNLVQLQSVMRSAVY